MKIHIQRSPHFAYCKRVVPSSELTTYRAHVEKTKVATCKQCIKALAKHERTTKREWH